MDLTLVSKILEQSINVNSIPFQPSTASVIAGTCSKEGHKSRALKIICARCLQNNQLQNVHNTHTISSIFDDAGQSPSRSLGIS